MADVPDWGLWDLFLWKVVPENLGGGRSHIQAYKDGWVRFNRAEILVAGSLHRLPAELIAGVCWIEVGGDPSFIDRVAFEVRSFDWSGPAWTDALTMTKRPEMTSFGHVSMQLRTAAVTLGLDAAKMTPKQWSMLSQALQKNSYNIRVVAKHLGDLLDHDRIGRSRPRLTADEVRIVGARYNRGTAPTLAQIRRNTSYGNLIVRLWPRFAGLLK